MATLMKATPYGVQAGGAWTFYPDDKAEMEYDIALFQAATMEGCGFCGRVPLEIPFIYNDALQKGFCNLSCLSASTGMCRCRNEAVFKIFIVVEGGQDYIIPIVVCRTCAKAIDKKLLLQKAYEMVCFYSQKAGVASPEFDDCSILFR